MLYRWNLLYGKKGGLLIGKTKKGKGTKVMAITDARGAMLSISVHPASPHEVTLVEKTLEDRSIVPKPERLIGDKAYDSDKLDEKLKEQGIDLIAPHRSGLKRPRTQDGRKLRLYTKCWKVERSFAWLFNYHRTAVRYEYHHEYFKAFLLLACSMILMKSFLQL